MATLKEKSEQILTEKELKIIPENIRKDTQIFDIVGEYEGQVINNQDKTITSNGTYQADQGYTGLGTVTVNVSGGGGSGDIKLFETIEEMQEDASAEEGDLAVVYREEIHNWDGVEAIHGASFPQTVVLPEVATENISIPLISRSSYLFDCWGELSQSYFTLDAHYDGESITVNYTSSDGINYTRIDEGDLYMDFGTEVIFSAASWERPYNPLLGYFFQIGGNVFDGFYQYGENKSLMKYVSSKGRTLYMPPITMMGDYEHPLNRDAILITVNEVDENGRILTGRWYGTYTTTEIEQYFYLNANNEVMSRYMDSPFSNTFSGGGCDFSVDWDNYTVTNTSEPSSEQDMIAVYSNESEYVSNILLYSDDTLSELLINGSIEYPVKYNQAATQLDAISGYVYEKTFYGKNGVEEGTLGYPDSTFTDSNAKLLAQIQEKYNEMQPRILTDDDKEIDRKILLIPTKFDGTPLLDTSNVTDMSFVFSDCTHLQTIPLLNTSNATTMYYMFSGCTHLQTIPLLDTSNVTNMYGIFGGCSNLQTIPLLDTSNVINMESMLGYCYNLQTVPLLDTSNVTNMDNMFSYCNNLQTVPLLDTSNVTDMRLTFENCSSLSNESLNNILAMCENATKITYNKTLRAIGLSDTQATICTTLSNWSACQAAGWSTGY